MEMQYISLVPGAVKARTAEVAAQLKHDAFLSSEEEQRLPLATCAVHRSKESHVSCERLNGISWEQVFPFECAAFEQGLHDLVDLNQVQVLERVVILGPFERREALKVGADTWLYRELAR